MFVLLLLFLLFDSNVQSKDVLVSKQELIDYIERKCLKNANASAFDALMKAADTLEFCCSRTSRPSRGSALEGLHDLICLDFPNVGYKCMKNAIEKLKPCLDAEADFLPGFVLGAFNKTIGHLCEGGLKAFVERLDSVEDHNCLYPSTLTIAVVAEEACVPNLILMRNGTGPDPDFVVTRSYICRELENVKSCLMDVLNSNCKDRAFSEYVSSFLSPILDGCNEDAF